MVGIDNSVKVAKLISDLNSTIENLKRENEYWRGKLEEEIERYVQERQENSNLSDKLKDINWQNDCLDGANKGIHAANKVLVERLNDEKEQKEKHIEFNKQLMSDLDKTAYERDKNRELADNYAAEAYEWQKKYYHEKEKHEKATKKVSEFKRKANFYKSEYKTNEWVKVILSAPKHKPYKHAKQQSDFDYVTNKVKFDETKEEILDLCDDIDSKINAWWKGRIYDPDFENAIDDDLSKIIKIVLSDNYNPSHDSNIIGICLKVKDKIRNWACYYDEDLVRDIQEAVSKIRKTVKEAE